MKLCDFEQRKCGLQRVKNVIKRVAWLMSVCSQMRESCVAVATFFKVLRCDNHKTNNGNICCQGSTDQSQAGRRFADVKGRPSDW